MTERPFTNQLDGDEDDCSQHAIIVIGGHPPDRRVLGVLPARHSVICADSGLDHALRLGLDPAVVIGDMDSVDPSSLEAARSRGCNIHEYVPDKDFTDTELALEFAVERGFRRITLVWGGGDRIDHVLGVIAALGHRRHESLESLDAWIAADRIDVVHPQRDFCIDFEIGTTLSLVSIGVDDAIVTTRGLEWNLNSDVLAKDRARGVSNLLVSPPGSIRCEQGVVALVTPGRLTEISKDAR